ncbi:MAG: CBS domain-containing protein [Methylococcales bacterium]|nr:CBS domain-containing protein [Methylococcales bacterium]
MKVSDWLAEHPIHAGVVHENWSLEQIMEKLLGNSRLNDLYVLNSNNQVIGHLSYKKLARLVLAEHCSCHTRSQILERVTTGSAAELMEAHFASASPDENLDEILYRQLDHWVEDLPVINQQGELVGVINLSDVLLEVMKSNN